MYAHTMTLAFRAGEAPTTPFLKPEAYRGVARAVRELPLHFVVYVGTLCGPFANGLYIYLKRYWRYMLALSSTSASVTWVRPREATRSSMRLRIKRRIKKGLRLMRRSASGSQVICLFSANSHLFQTRLLPQFYSAPVMPVTTNAQHRV